MTAFRDTDAPPGMLLQEKLTVSAVRPCRIETETDGDAAAIEALYDAAFGPGHFAKTAERLREYSRPEAGLCAVARSNDRPITAACRQWRITIGGSLCLLTGPVAVLPAYRGDALGLRVTSHALDAAAAEGWPGALLIGAPDYFERIGFEAVPRGHVRMPGPQNPARILWKSLRHGAPCPHGVARGVRLRASPPLSAFPAPRP